MQTAVDRNDSSNTTTIINNAPIEDDNKTSDTMTQLQQHHILHQQAQQHDYHPTHSLIERTGEPEATNILRHRINISNNNGTNCGAIAAPNNGLPHVIHASEYLGSKVTPSPSPKPSSPKKCTKLLEDVLNLSVASAATSTLQDIHKPNTSSEPLPLKTASNSASTTSSVIACPIVRHNGNFFKEKQQNESLKQEVASTEGIGDSDGGNKYLVGIDAAPESCKQSKECNNKQLSTNQRLPYENISSITIIKKELSSISLPMSSSTTSLSITAVAVTNTDKPLMSTTNSTPSPSSSSTISSSSTSTTYGTSTASDTTPALLSTPSSASSSSLASSSSASSFAPASADSKIKGLSISGLVEAELLQWHDMPQYLQFNPYVLKGYRPLTTFKGCLLSLFYWHNETINILTHALPIIYILAIVPGLMPWENGYRFLSFCHVFGSVAPWCGSFVYHLFMNIERGEDVYYKLLKLDMVGIWVSQSFGALPLVTATTFCFTFKWKWFIIISYCLLSLWGLYKALTASSPWQRRLCFALPFAMRSILTFFRTIGLVGGNRVALEHVYLQDGVSILGGAIGAMRIPEKWFPGLVDFYLNSHNIMHVLVVVAVYSMYKATMKDFEWMESTNCDAFVNITSEVLETTLNAKIEL